MTVATRVRRKAKKLPDEELGPMNRGELIRSVAEDADCALEDAEWMVEVVLEAMARPIVRGRGLRLTGFGSWILKKRGSRWARNPQTGERVRVDAVNAVTFAPGQRLKDLVNGKLKLTKGERIVAKKPKTLKAKPEGA